MDPSPLLDLADWRHKVAALYLSGVDLDGFRAGRDHLFRTHPQAPAQASPRYFPADPAFVVEATIEPASGHFTVDTGDTDGAVTYERVGILHTPLGPLSLWWIRAYGGGLFLPLRDSTSGKETYGGGRYLTDTVKGTFGRGLTMLSHDRARLDFNYAYNPSCAYSPQWTCPLAPPENHLTAPVTAGELTFAGQPQEKTP